MRASNGLVDSLIWLLKAGVQQKTAADEKVQTAPPTSVVNMYNVSVACRQCIVIVTSLHLRFAVLISHIHILDCREHSLYPP